MIPSGYIEKSKRSPKETTVKIVECILRPPKTEDLSLQRSSACRELGTVGRAARAQVPNHDGIRSERPRVFGTECWHVFGTWPGCSWRPRKIACFVILGKCSQQKLKIVFKNGPIGPSGLVVTVKEPGTKPPVGSYHSFPFLGYKTLWS